MHHKGFVRTLSLALVLSLGAAAHAQVRSHVAIVRPVLHEETKTFILDLAQSMGEEGYADAAEYLKAWAEGGFGSGFVYVNPANGDNFIVTNRHVVAQAETVTLEFEKEDGSLVTYQDCPVIAVSESLDLALVIFPNGAKPFDFGIPLSKVLPSDGVDIWSAGYPGLLSRPSWQFGKGSITNNRARIPELADPAIAELIQHSAPIDSGSSGGPLLVAKASSKLGYEVVGVNTWKVGGRQDTNFAIPAKHISDFLALTLSGEQTDASEDLRARAASLPASVYSPEDAYKKLVKLISYGYVAKNGEADLKNVLDRAPTAIRDHIIATFVGVSPIDGLRLASAWTLSNKILRTSGDALALSSSELSSNYDGLVQYSLGGETIPTTWVLEHGYWRLDSFPLTSGSSASTASTGSKTKASEAGVEITSPYQYAFVAGASLDLGPSEIFLIEGGLQGLLAGEFLAWSFSFGGGSALAETGEKATLIIFKGSAVLQLPVNFGNITLTPFARGGGGLLLPFGFTGEEYAGFYSTLGGGLSVCFWDQSFGLSVEYGHITRASLDSLSSSDEKPTNQVLTVSLVYTVN